MIRLLAIAMLMLAGGLGPAAAHEVRPAFLQIDETQPGHFTASWKQPVIGEFAVRLDPRLSNGWLDGPPAAEFVTAAYRIRTWRNADGAHDPLAGVTIGVRGLERTITDAVVQVRLADGRSFDTILKPAQPSARVDFGHAGGLAVPAYFSLGVEHILTGVDHLMFVLGLLLLVGIRWRLVKAITAFTAAHSITLGVSALGLVHAPSTVIEALVALSIVFVAVELADPERRRNGLAARKTWVIAFIFGLLHGFAFAGALAEVGLPQHAIPAALFLFNVGVEAGQLLFVGAAILVILALRSVWPRLPAGYRAALQPVPSYAIGAFAAFWFLERATAAFA